MIEIGNKVICRNHLEYGVGRIVIDFCDDSYAVRFPAFSVILYSRELISVDKIDYTTGILYVDTTFNKLPDIINYTYNETTAVTTIEWSDGTKTTVRAENPDTADPHTGFVTAYAKRAAGNNNMINKLYDEWAIKKPAREAKAQIKANAAALEEQRIAKKRKAKKEKYLIRKRAAEINKEYEAKKLACEKYGVPMDYKAGDTN